VSDGFTVESLNAVLEPMIQAIAFDGYILRVVDASESSLHLAIDATPDACADCLAPATVLAGIISQSLTVAGISVVAEDISIDYPPETDAH
jgi:hypothetical protein